MERLKAYRVTKGSSDGTFVPGNIIWQSPNGEINTMYGTLLNEEQSPETMDFECVEDNKWKVIRTDRCETLVKL